MSGIGNGDASNYVFRDEHDALDGRVVTLAENVKTFQGRIGRRVQIVEQKTDAALEDIRADLGRIRRIETVQKEHSDVLARIESGIIKVEKRLAEQDEKLEDVEETAERAERASGTNEHILDQNDLLVRHVVSGSKVHHDRSRDSIRARQDRRSTLMEFASRYSNWLFVGGGCGATVLLYILAKLLGVELP